MDLLFTHKQEKTNKKLDNVASNCELTLSKDDKFIYYEGNFNFIYTRYGEKRNLTHSYYFSVNIKTGNIHCKYILTPHQVSKNKLFRPTKRDKKNNFELLFDCVEDGLIHGEKKTGFWGTKYQKAVDKIYNMIDDILRPNFKSDFYKNKEHTEKYTENPLYDLIVDYHLDMKGIKAHDKIYSDIQYDYPLKKWLTKNENKFLPAVLDSYGIKSKYLISELNTITNPVYIKSVNYFCKLFGENYIDYIKQIKWQGHCYTLPFNKKTHMLKNEAEKKCMVSLLNNWEKNFIKSETALYSVNKLLSTREFIEGRGLNLKFKTKTTIDFDFLMDSWVSIKSHMNKGYKLKYHMPDEFIQMIEKDIVIDNQTFKSKLLITEDDFRVEGYDMKNCMNAQFVHGILYLYVTLQSGRKKINLQYRRGVLSQMYGKANTKVDDSFLPAVSVLSTRFEKEPNIHPKKIKYDIIKK